MQPSVTLTNKLKKNGTRKIKVRIVCECGINISGNSIDNAKANLKLHLKSKLHKKQMESQKIIKEGETKK